MEIEAECSGTTTNNAEELVEEEGGGGGDRWSILIGDGKAAAAAAVYLLWEDLTVLLPNFIRSSGGGRPRSHTKRLLNAITGFALPGRIMAIMGPSGSGKSTLLDSLAGNTYIHTNIHINRLVHLCSCWVYSCLSISRTMVQNIPKTKIVFWAMQPKRRLIPPMLFGRLTQGPLPLYMKKIKNIYIYIWYLNE